MVVDAIGVTPTENMKLATYQLNDVSQMCIQQLSDGRPLREGAVDWEGLKIAFL